MHAGVHSVILRRPSRPRPFWHNSDSPYLRLRSLYSFVMESYANATATQVDETESVLTLIERVGTLLYNESDQSLQVILTGGDWASEL